MGTWRREINTGWRWAKMWIMSGRGGNIKSSDRRMCSDTQGIHPSRRDCVGKINVKVEERLRDLEKKKNRKTSGV